MKCEIKEKISPSIEIMEKYLRREPLLRLVMSASFEDEVDTESFSTATSGGEQCLKAYVCISNNMREIEIS